MDPATLIGIALALIVIVVANVLEGGSPASLILLPPMLLVFGGTIAVSLAGGTLRDFRGSLLALKIAFLGKVRPASDVVPTVVALADKARKEGLLSLEESIKTLDDPFMARGVTMAVDGIDSDELREILESEVYAKRAQDKQSAKFFTDAGGYAPTIGIVGTVMSLVHVLENLDKPAELGHMIAAAFLATLWGVLSANALWLPIAAKLKRFSEIECARMEIVIEGVLAIQSGSNPRVVAQKLRSLLPSDQQQTEAA